LSGIAFIPFPAFLDKKDIAVRDAFIPFPLFLDGYFFIELFVDVIVTITSRLNQIIYNASLFVKT